MDAANLKELAQRLAEQREFITNEETAKMALVVPFIRLLGYEPNSPREVRLEYCADFAQADGKKLPDRMDFAIFDKTGAKPLMVIETKPMGTDLAAKAQQLARYIAQMRDLHFGIITDGCRYLFYGDLESQNQMDREPFFTFALDDPKVDWEKVAKFLSKFSRDSFDAGTLATEAENARYREAMVNKLAAALKAPNGDDGFLRWLTADVYKGLRTAAVMARLGEVARDAIEPALLRAISNEFIEKLRENFQRALDNTPAPVRPTDPPVTVGPAPAKTVRARDPRLPPPGTPISKTWKGKKVDAVEQADGTFTLAVDGQTTTTGAKSLSGAVETLLRAAGLTGGVNGFAWFGLTKATNGQQASAADGGTTRP